VNRFLRLLFFLIACFFYLLPAGRTHAQQWQVDSLVAVTKSLRQFEIPANHIFQRQSLRVYQNQTPLKENSDYRLEESLIRFFPPLQSGDTLRVTYRRLPFDFKPSYSLYQRDTLSADSTFKDSGRVALRTKGIENPFADIGGGLQKSGSIFRGVNVGSNRDLTLNSGLNLELSGQLTRDVEIIAALTDEATPIQPEGNTQTLEEVDRVFIQFRHPNVEGTVGDLNLEYKGTEFANLSRKLQGLSLLGRYTGQYAGATYATTRGFFHRVTFIGQEGNQGPYQLTGKNGEREIIVLAGTERVYVNGQQMTRGESNDYIIEYGNGQIVFTNNRLITSESRIEVDFEYFPAIQKFNRNALSGLAGGEWKEGNLSYRVSYYREQDNTDQVLGEGEALTDEERDVLRGAGDDFLEATLPGGTFVGAGKGSYVKGDTLFSDSTYSYFRFVGAGDGDYNVSFTFVGRGEGNYSRTRIGRYNWVGPNRGSYTDLRLVPLPQDQHLTDISLEWNPDKIWRFKSEWAISDFDRNTFSALDSDDDRGQAFSFSGEAQNLDLGAAGTMDTRLQLKSINANFESADRVQQPDFQRYWNVLEQARQSREEQSAQLSGRYLPFDELKLGFNGGVLKKEQLNSQRVGGNLQFNRQSWFETQWNYEQVDSELKQDDVSNSWQRLGGEVARPLLWFKPALLYEFERRRNETPARVSGFRFNDYGARLALFEWQHLEGFTQYNLRRDEVYDIDDKGMLLPQAESRTARLKLELTNISNTSASLELIRRSKDFTSFFENIRIDTLKLQYADAAVQDTVWQDRETNLAELRVTHNRWNNALGINLQYRISTEQTALREKVYLEVGQGRGSFRFDDDLQEYVPDPDGDFVLFVLPTGQFTPITKMESALRLNYDPSRFWRRPVGEWQKLLSYISGSSYFRVEEETREDDLLSIYLLDLSKFQKGQTLRGSIVYDQDLYINRRNRDLNFRLLFRYRDDLFNQFLDPDENEDRLTIERGFRTDWRITNTLRSQSEIRQKLTIRDTPTNPLRNRDINAWFLEQQFSWRPFQRWELGMDLEYGRENNRAESYPLELWFGVLAPEVNYQVAGKGRVQLRYEYQSVSVLSNPLDLTVPFEMALGKKEGVSKKWNLRAEYTVAKNILFTLQYTGRDEAGFREVIHTGQAEVRAFF